MQQVVVSVRQAVVLVRQQAVSVRQAVVQLAAVLAVPPEFGWVFPVVAFRR